jgi:hypothetical protein
MRRFGNRLFMSCHKEEQSVQLGHLNKLIFISKFMDKYTCVQKKTELFK